MQATEGDKKNKGEGGHGSGGWGRRWSPPTTPLPSYVIDAIQAVYSPSIKTEEIPSSSSSNDTSNWNPMNGRYYTRSVPIDHRRSGSSRKKESESNQKLVVTTRSGRSSTRKRQKSSHQTTTVTKKKVKKSKRDKKDQTNVKNMVSPFFSLTKSLQLQILEYCTVPMLGTLVPVCKEFNRMVKHRNKLWEPFLRQLLCKLYDDAIVEGHNPNPLIERIDWRQSTSMVCWIDSCRPLHTKKETINCHVFDNLYDVDAEDEEHEGKNLRWLFQNVSLRDYYHQAGRMAYLNIKDEHDMWEESCEENNRCTACNYKTHSCVCDGEYYPNDVDYSDFIDLPNIQWWE